MYNLRKPSQKGQITVVLWRSQCCAHPTTLHGAVFQVLPGVTPFGQPLYMYRLQLLANNRCAISERRAPGLCWAEQRAGSLTLSWLGGLPTQENASFPSLRVKLQACSMMGNFRFSPSGRVMSDYGTAVACHLLIPNSERVEDFLHHMEGMDVLGHLQQSLLAPRKRHQKA